jgi:hypothetical protein
MRGEADFISVNSFAESLFNHEDVKPLNLRYFNPTQSWINDRVAKGLVEALMLRRAALTIYMAQKSDTFGKDSEASVALGQGKSVVVYVPKLSWPRANIDSELIGKMSRADLEAAIADEGDQDEDREPDATMDNDALIARLLTIRISGLGSKDLSALVKSHWSDYDIYAEVERVKLEKREKLRIWLDMVTKGKSDDAVPSDLYDDVVGALVAVSVTFEKRARLFREVHPLALQIIVSTGVLNGMLVVRSVEACARVVEALIKNSLIFKLEKDPDNYRLVESTTGSVARVISRNPLITSAFATHYEIVKL